MTDNSVNQNESEKQEHINAWVDYVPNKSTMDDVAKASINLTTKERFAIARAVKEAFIHGRISALHTEGT